MNKLQKLIEKTKCSVNLTINKHKDYYQSVSEYITELKDRGQIDNNDIDEAIYLKMIERDIIIELQFYPTTPVGFYSLIGYDLEEILDRALK